MLEPRHHGARLRRCCPRRSWCCSRHLPHRHSRRRYGLRDWGGHSQACSHRCGHCRHPRWRSAQGALPSPVSPRTSRRSCRGRFLHHFEGPASCARVHKSSTLSTSTFPSLRSRMGGGIDGFERRCGAAVGASVQLAQKRITDASPLSTHDASTPSHSRA